MSYLANLEDEISKHADEILEMFKPGSKITILIRNPKVRKDGEADVVVTNDDLEESILAIRRRINGK